MQKKPVSAWMCIAALAAFLCVLLGLLCCRWNERTQELEWNWGGRPLSHMDAARNADTSNFDNVLKF